MEVTVSDVKLGCDRNGTGYLVLPERVGKDLIAYFGTATVGVEGRKTDGSVWFFPSEVGVQLRRFQHEGKSPAVYRANFSAKKYGAPWLRGLSSRTPVRSVQVEGRKLKVGVQTDKIRAGEVKEPNLQTGTYRLQLEGPGVMVDRELDAAMALQVMEFVLR